MLGEGESHLLVWDSKDLKYIYNRFLQQLEK